MSRSLGHKVKGFSSTLIPKYLALKHPKTMRYLYRYEALLDLNRPHRNHSVSLYIVIAPLSRLWPRCRSSSRSTLASWASILVTINSLKHICKLSSSWSPSPRHPLTSVIGLSNGVQRLPTIVEPALVDQLSWRVGYPQSLGPLLQLSNPSLRTFVSLGQLVYQYLDIIGLISKACHVMLMLLKINE